MEIRTNMQIEEENKVISFAFILDNKYVNLSKYNKFSNLGLASLLIDIQLYISDRFIFNFKGGWFRFILIFQEFIT